MTPEQMAALWQQYQGGQRWRPNASPTLPQTVPGTGGPMNTPAGFQGGMHPPGSPHGWSGGGGGGGTPTPTPTPTPNPTGQQTNPFGKPVWWQWDWHIPSTTTGTGGHADG